MLEVTIIIAILITLVLLTKLGGLELIVNAFIALVGFIFSLLIAVLVIGCLCLVGVIVVPILIVIAICAVIMEIFEKCRRR